MSSLEIMLNKEMFKPGEKVEGNLFLNLNKTIKIKDIIVGFYGNEHTEITRTRYNSITKKHETQIYTENVEVVDEAKSLIEQVRLYTSLEQKDTTTLTTNVYTLPFSFTLPENASPSYDGEHAKVSYELSAKVDIPWKFDLKAEKEIYVTPGDVFDEKGEAVVLNEKSGGILPQALSPDINMTVELAKTLFKRGGLIKGKVAVTNRSGKAIRNILLDLYANEHAEAEGYTEDTTVMHHDLKVPVNQPELSYFEQNFELLAPEAMPTIKRKYFSIEWYFKIGLDVAKAMDLEVELPLIIK